jgi:EAL domain-containing protein (putative c-di-GMP-specific phosphodiesterase class I)
VANKIIKAVTSYQFCWFKKLFQIGASIGIVLLDDSVQTCSELRLCDDGEIHEPAAFMPAAERYQYMASVDHWVVEQTYKFLSNPNNTLAEHSKVSINISGQILVDMKFVKFVIDKLQQYAIIPERIIFEITETAAIANFQKARRIIKRLKKIGYAFSLDDFGSGMSSFSYLKNLPVDFLKIDGSFVKSIVENQDDYVMVQAISQIGRSMNIKTIAEFAEDQAIIDKLVELEIELAQGYALGKPVPVKQYLSKPLRSAG